MTENNRQAPDNGDRLDRATVSPAGRQAGMPPPARALIGGAAGAVTVTALNEAARRLVPRAPRLDALGRRGLVKMLRLAGVRPPTGDAQFRWAMAGDLASNTVYYSLVGAGAKKRPWLRGALLGLGAGVGAALLPPRVGLGRRPTQDAPTTQLLTVAWYFAGGLAAAAAYRPPPSEAGGARSSASAAPAAGVASLA